MRLEAHAYTMGVEEEFHLVDRATRQLAPIAGEVVTRAQARIGSGVHAELRTSQIEIATPVCQTLAEVRQQLRKYRRALSEAAGELGGAIMASGTHPFSAWQEQGFVDDQRYEDLLRDFRHLAREQVICGCHVHVGLADPDVRIAVLNRARVWLSPLLALAANSPYWQERIRGMPAIARSTGAGGRFPARRSGSPTTRNIGHSSPPSSAAEQSRTRPGSTGISGCLSAYRRSSSGLWTCARQLTRR